MRFVFKKKKINTMYNVQRSHVHQNCLVTNIIQNIFCLPQAKEMHPVLELFWVNYTFKWTPPHKWFHWSNQSGSHLSRKDQDQWNPQGRICAELVWETQILQLLAVLNYAENGRSNQAWCIVGYSILCNSVEYCTFCLEIPCVQNICILCAVYKVYCILQE